MDNLSQFFSKKAYEISYAALRVSSAIKVQSFIDRFSEQACLLLDLAARGRYSECKNIAESMECLFRLGGDIGIVHPLNVQSMVQEIRQFNSAIAEYEKLVKQPIHMDLDGSFSKMPAHSSDKKENFSNSALSQILNHENKDLAYESEPQQKENIPGAAKSAIRQSAILEIIRQNGNLPGRQVGCRLKDIQDSFDDVSERTIRYDLQDIIERGLIERIGSGGPATYYKIRQTDNGGGIVRQS